MTMASFPPSPTDQQELLRRIKKEGHVSLIGVTGGIATGKTTVARMLAEQGAFTIDLDVIARQVVEQGKPAWGKIVAYFGREVLLADGALDRKKLSAIVFRDPTRKKKLEGFTHPLIFEALARQAKEMAGSHPGAIIQVVVPLLLECDLQHMFDKVVVVYCSETQQIERLKKRDGSSQEESKRILQAQRPIDEKPELADFVIHNGWSLPKTKEQVQALWETLNKMV